MKFITLLITFGLLNFISWNYFGILFICNIILIYHFINVSKNTKWYFYVLKSYLLLFIFNISSTYWLIFTEDFKGFYAFLTNAALMLPILVFSIFIEKKYANFGKFFFIFAWVFFEWLYTNWYLAWSWLNFGHVLGNQWYLIKWYSFVGTYGGSLWLLLFSLFLLDLINKKSIKLNVSLIVIFSLLPMHSLFNYTFIEEKVLEKIPVLCLTQQNAKYDTYSNYKKIKLIHKYIKINKTSNYLLTPELFFREIHLDDFKSLEINHYLSQIFKINPSINLFIGTELKNTEHILFNGIAVISKNSTLFRTKKKYVPIAEYTPKILRSIFNENYFSINTNDEQEQIKLKFGIFPFVCYESIFSTFFAKNAVNTKVIFLSASEIFMKDSKIAQQQYLNIIRIRAIETGKSILKVSNSGTSCLINPNGKIEKTLKKDFETVFVPVYSKNSFYQKIISFL